MPGKKGKETSSFPIVGIGASAGGLEALEGFFTNMPSDSNIAFIIIQHLDPTHESMMSSLLTKYTKMKIKVVKEGLKIEPNCVYLNPPNKNVFIINRTLQLMELERSHVINLPIDYFFRSLSDDLGEKAICIILSGTGTDGTLGLRAIKEAGGMTMVQDERQAKYDGMPRSAINTGLVDYILKIENMPGELIKYIRQPYINGTSNARIPELQFQNYIQKIFALIRTVTGHDFSNYKQNTIRRRIERRMAVHQIDKIIDYIRFMQQHPGEIEILYKDLLITVTNFFRDADSFKVLQEKVIPELVEKKQPDSSIRVWVPGCATGEEAYSIAILLIEAIHTSKKHINVQIFATDIDNDAIEYARLAIYPESITADVPQEQLKRFFTKENHFYKMKKQVREVVVFAMQNLIKDPPFSKLDMVCCRNLLIYMNQVLQKRILPLFHYTLKEDGILFLGSSESIGEFTDLFMPVDAKWKIYKRKGGMISKDIDYPRIPYNDGNVVQRKIDDKKILKENDIRNMVEKIILENYSLPSVLINEHYEILFFNGNTGRFLTLPTGEAHYNILNMARDDLRLNLSSALHKANKQRTTIVQNNLRVKHNNTFITFDLIVRPITTSEEKQGLMLVVFQDKTVTETQAKIKKKSFTEKEQDQHLAVLEQELHSTKEYLQTTIEELETSNEELKSTNEELQSTNEELQSTNEELETSKEEMQSTNEELVTVNAELQDKVDELSRANNDINNLLASTEIGTIFLDNNLYIKRFTPAVTKIFNLIESDINRLISDITTNLRYDSVHKDAKNVLDTLVKREIELQDKKGEWYSMRITPYRTVDNIIDGVVITFVNINEIKQTKVLQQLLATVVTASNDAVTIQDLKGTITAWNKGAELMYGYTEAEALKMNISETVPRKKRKEALDLIEQIATGKTVESLETQRLTKDGRVLDVWLTVTKLMDEKGNITAVATTERDITERKRKEEEHIKEVAELKKLLAELQQQVKRFSDSQEPGNCK